MISLGVIKRFPSQILSVFLGMNNKVCFHMEIDLEATINYIREYEVKKIKFTILPNKQISKLGDGVTILHAVGEIKVQFFRKL